MDRLAERIVAATTDIALSGRVGRTRETPARGLIVALHGGGYSAGYWDCPTGDGLSLVKLGADLGYHVLALDRPGYGASHDFDPSRLTNASQVELLFDIIDTWCEENAFAGPVYLIGHSIGGILTLLMAAHPRSARLGGVDVLGVPFRFPPSDAGAEVNSWMSAENHLPLLSEENRRWLLFGPAGTYDEAASDYDATLTRPLPVGEYRDALKMPEQWAQVLPSIQIPVQFNLAQYELMQATGWDILNEVHALLHNNPHASVHLQQASGHNASTHRVARAYHLRAIAFFEECRARAAG